MPKTLVKIDWLTIILFVLLVGFGWINIYSTSVTDLEASWLDFNEIHGKQLLWIGLSLILIMLILALEAKFYQQFSSLIYVVALLSLVGLLFFGKTIAGQTAWYSFGSFSIQPAEFVKAAVALAMAKYLTGINIHLKNFKHQIQALVIIGVPMFLIMLQPDAGSALIYVAFIIPMYREGLPDFYLVIGIFIALIFVLTLKFGFYYIGATIVFIAFLVYFFNRNKKPQLSKYLLITLLCIGFSISVGFIYEQLQPHQKDRFDLILGKIDDISGKGYNTYQGKVAIGSGGLSGRGWLNGTHTQGKFVPEQHTDYIFVTVGEEFGFIGSTIVVLLFVFLMIRLVFLAERQKSHFSRIYGYSVFGIIFFHFFVNIAMVLGLFPTVGIPLPFFSYGGSSLWGFTVLIFIFLKLDAKRMEF